MFEGQFFFVSAELIHRYTDAYPGVSVVTELKKMECWLEANPERRKRNYNRFINNWLAKIHGRLLEAEVATMVREDIRRNRVPL